MCNFSKWQLPESVLAAVLGLNLFLPRRSGPLPILIRSDPPHCSLWILREPNLTFGKLMLLGKLQIWQFATWEVNLNILGDYVK